MNLFEKLTASVKHPVAIGALLLLGCAGESPAPAPDATTQGAAACVPSRSMYDAVVAQHIENHCGTCHGQTPQFGAPNSLTSGYDSLVEGEVGSRWVDRIAARVANKTMPPVGTNPVPHQAQDTLVEWASCGEMHTDHSVGLVVNRPVFEAPAEAPTGLETLDLTAGGFEVSETTLDLYQCFGFEMKTDADRFIRRIEPLVDVSQVLHHVVLLKDLKKKFPIGTKPCSGSLNNTQYLYAWAPGGGALQFPEGGLRVKSGERYIVQIHYNNGAGVKNVKDNSGVRLLHGPPEGKEFGMFVPGPNAFVIPPKSTSASTGNCVIEQDMELLAGMPHMHELGRAFRQDLVRADGTRESVVELTGWAFEMQPFYHFPMQLKKGDRLETTCTWRNDGDDAVMTGEDTDDEMCFNFTYASPPPKSPYCNEIIMDKEADVAYVPGKCAPADADKMPPRTTHPPILKSVGDPTGGTFPQKTWRLTYASLVIGPVGKAFLADDPGLFIARGQAWTDGDQLTMDAVVRVMLQTKQGAGIDSMDIVSIAGTVKEGKSVGVGEWVPTCGGASPQPIRWSVTDKQLTVTLDKTFSGYTIPGIYVFEPVP